MRSSSALRGGAPAVRPSCPRPVERPLIPSRDREDLRPLGPKGRACLGRRSGLDQLTEVQRETRGSTCDRHPHAGRPRVPRRSRDPPRSSDSPSGTLKRRAGPNEDALFAKCRSIHRARHGQVRQGAPPAHPRRRVAILWPRRVTETGSSLQPRSAPPIPPSTSPRGPRPLRARLGAGGLRRSDRPGGHLQGPSSLRTAPPGAPRGRPQERRYP